MKRYILALDQGTTSTRAVLVDEQGTIQASVQKELEQIYPMPGWVEHDAEQIWRDCLGALRQVLQKTGVLPGQVAAIGITNQRETTVVWDRKTGRPICNAIVWQCRRTSDVCDTLRREGKADVIYQKTGLVLDAYFSATKLAWILDRVEGARQKAERGELLFGTIDSWILYNLTGGKVHATDYTNAARTMLYNIHTLQWDSELLQLFDIPSLMLPEVRDSSGQFGVCDATLLGEPIPICGIAGDQQASLVGQGCFLPGDSKNTYGTGCFLMMHTGEKAVQTDSGLLTTIALGMDGKVTYALEGSVFIGGAAVQWLRDEMKLIETAAESEQHAMAVADSGGVYVVPAFVGLGAPYWDMYARGAVLGLTRGSNRDHVIRATLESIAYQVEDVLDTMRRVSGFSVDRLRVDGGACANNFLMQFQSDISNLSLLRPQVIETTVRGAAFLAGLASGVWSDTDAICNLVCVQKHFLPTMQRETRDKLLQGWRQAVQRCSGWSKTE